MVGIFVVLKSTLSSSQSERNMSGMAYGATEGLLDEKDDEVYNSVEGEGRGMGGLSPQQ